MWQHLRTCLKLTSPLSAIACLQAFTGRKGKEDHAPQKPRLKDPLIDLQYYGKNRSNYLKWEDYFMALTFLTESRCKASRKQQQVGASIFNNESNKLVGIGYNWTPEDDGVESHAVLNAVLNRNTADLKNCTLYVSSFPCSECAKVIIQSGIKTVVYYAVDNKDRPEIKASKKMLSEAGVTYKPFKTKLTEIKIDFRGKDSNVEKSPQNTQKSEDKRMADSKREKGCALPDNSESKNPSQEEKDYFMGIAFIASERSKDPVTQVGACIVNEENKVLGIGYNGMPIGILDEDSNWGKNEGNILESKKLAVCHAELNAVLFRNVADIRNSSLYVTLFPCKECAKVVIQAGIKKVYYYSDKYHYKESYQDSRRMLEKAGVELEQFTSMEDEIHIEFKPNRCIWE